MSAEAKGTEGPGASPKRSKEKGENKMDFYSMEQFEIMADAMEEVQEWLTFEADMETHPFD